MSLVPWQICLRLRWAHPVGAPRVHPHEHWANYPVKSRGISAHSERCVFLWRVLTQVPIGSSPPASRDVVEMLRTLSAYHAVPVRPISPDHEQPHGLGGPGYGADTRR